MSDIPAQTVPAAVCIPVLLKQNRQKYYCKSIFSHRKHCMNFELLHKVYKYNGVSRLTKTLQRSQWCHWNVPSLFCTRGTEVFAVNRLKVQVQLWPYNKFSRCYKRWKPSDEIFWCSTWLCLTHRVKAESGNLLCFASRQKMIPCLLSKHPECVPAEGTLTSHATRTLFLSSCACVR